jgi:predicted NBD/HSP70 family sugar kinase
MQKTISGNAKIVRDINRAMILNIIRKNQPISRSTIARMTGLNKSTVSSIVTDLLQEELVYEQVKEDRNVGRNPIDLSLKLGRSFIGAINIDSAFTYIGVVDIDGSILAESKFDTRPANPASFISLCVKKLNSLCSKANIKKLEGLGISVAGIVDSIDLVVDFAPNLGWEDLNIGKEFLKHLPELKIIAVGNDAKSSALAELWFGEQGVDLSNFVFLSIGDGIGAGIVVEGKLLQGEFQAAGEVGHMILIEGGDKCVCGNYGCWERYGSDIATVKRYLKEKKRDNRIPDDFSIDEILKLSNNGDEIAKKVLTETGEFLGLGIATIVKAFDPHAIIIGGRITQAWNIIYPQILKEVEKRAFYSRNKNIIIIPTSLRVSPRLLGAATLAIKEIFDDYKITI